MRMLDIKEKSDLPDTILIERNHSNVCIFFLYFPNSMWRRCLLNHVKKLGINEKNLPSLLFQVCAIIAFPSDVVNMFESPTAAPCCYLLGFLHLGETAKSEQHFNLWGCSPASLMVVRFCCTFQHALWNVSENPPQRAFVVGVLLLRIQLANTLLNTFVEGKECSVEKCSVCYRRPGCSGRRTDSIANKVILQIYECAQFS